MTQLKYRLNPISTSDAAALRNAGGPVYVADANPGYPCRQCLLDAAIGEELILVAHDPFDETSTSPYRSRSPIFLHRDDCGSPGDDATIPEQLACRVLSVRSFDQDDLMIDAAVIDGTEIESTLETMFADTASEMVHVHNASRGCWAVRIDRR